MSKKFHSDTHRFQSVGPDGENPIRIVGPDGEPKGYYSPAPFNQLTRGEPQVVSKGDGPSLPSSSSMIPSGSYSQVMTVYITVRDLQKVIQNSTDEVTKKVAREILQQVTDISPAQYKTLLPCREYIPFFEPNDRCSPSLTKVLFEPGHAYLKDMAVYTRTVPGCAELFPFGHEMLPIGLTACEELVIEVHVYPEVYETAAPVVDHATMDHSMHVMKGEMDHSNMAGMDHSSMAGMSGMDHAAMGHAMGLRLPDEGKLDDYHKEYTTSIDDHWKKTWGNICSAFLQRGIKMYDKLESDIRRVYDSYQEMGGEVWTGPVQDLFTEYAVSYTPKDYDQLTTFYYTKKRATAQWNRKLQDITYGYMDKSFHEKFRAEAYGWTKDSKPWEDSDIISKYEIKPHYRSNFYAAVRELCDCNSYCPQSTFNMELNALMAMSNMIPDESGYHAFTAKLRQSCLDSGKDLNAWDHLRQNLHTLFVREKIECSDAQWRLLQAPLIDQYVDYCKMMGTTKTLYNGKCNGSTEIPYPDGGYYCPNKPGEKCKCPRDKKGTLLKKVDPEKRAHPEGGYYCPGKEKKCKCPRDANGNRLKKCDGEKKPYPGGGYYCPDKKEKKCECPRDTQGNRIKKDHPATKTYEDDMKPYDGPEGKGYQCPTRVGHLCKCTRDETGHRVKSDPNEVKVYTMKGNWRKTEVGTRYLHSVVISHTSCLTSCGRNVLLPTNGTNYIWVLRPVKLSY